MIDFSNLMNVQGNKDRSFQNPGTPALASIMPQGMSMPQTPMAQPPGSFSLPGIQPGLSSPGAGYQPQAGLSSPGLGSAPMNIMPGNSSQQPGFPSLEAILSMIQGIFSQPGSAASGVPQGMNSGLPASGLPPPSPVAAMMQRKQAGSPY